MLPWGHRNGSIKLEADMQIGHFDLLMLAINRPKGVDSLGE